MGLTALPELQGIGVQLERWRADRELVADADQAAVITAYRDSIDRLMQAYGFQSVDVISVRPDHPDKVALRNKFLAEHTHDDFEARFFVDGQGLFYVHPDDKVYLVLCEQGDLISVLAHTRHWFDMGENPNLKAIRPIYYAGGLGGALHRERYCKKVSQAGAVCS